MSAYRELIEDYLEFTAIQGVIMSFEMFKELRGVK